MRRLQFVNDQQVVTEPQGDEPTMMRIIEKLKDRVGGKKDAATEGPPISPLGGTATDSGDTAGSAPGGSAPGDSGPADLSQPITLQHVWTSEPNAVKLQLSRMIWLAV